MPLFLALVAIQSMVGPSSTLCGQPAAADVYANIAVKDIRVSAVLQVMW